MSQKRLTRSHSRMIAGVCGGFASYFGIDPTIVRVGLVFLAVFTAIFPCLVAYAICVVVIPNN